MLPLLRRGTATSTSGAGQSGFLALLRLNHLLPPFNNPAIRHAIFPAVDQSDYMIAIAGRTGRCGGTSIGFITPGPMASDVGMAALTGPREPAKAKAGAQGMPATRARKWC